ncbi:MAG TPA: YlbF family regulator [Verrucomicrobiae bacterium]|nr:YlbF family regulator [Verrucomicrobiae bacterium]
MTTQTADSIIVQKTRELCQTIVEQPEFQSIRQRIDTFMADDVAKVQYQTVVEKGDMLQHKQQMGLPMSAEEISDFEKNRDALINNPVARDFLDAQQAMQKVQESVGQYVAKTFELGRPPSEEDFHGCGSGCGCSH